MSKGNDPAFPWTGGERPFSDGLTKREYFAGLALQGMLSGLPTDIPAEDAYPPLQAATDAIAYADNLLAELEKGGGNG